MDTSSVTIEYASSSSKASAILMMLGWSHSDRIPTSVQNYQKFLLSREGLFVALGSILTALSVSEILWVALNTVEN